MNIFFFLIVLLHSYLCANFPSKPVSGLDVIQFPSLSFPSNFKKENIGDDKAYFTADKSTPNFYGAYLGTAQFYAEGDPDSSLNTLPPLVAFDNWKDLVVGISLPAWDNQVNTLQIIGFKSLINSGNNTIGNPFKIDGYNPANIIIDRSTQSAPNGMTAVYSCGFGPNGFFVLALFINTNTLEFSNFNQNIDLMEGILPNSCFDLYDTVSKPDMWIDYQSRNLVISMGERCGYFIFVPLVWNPQGKNPFGIPAVHSSFQYVALDSSYVAASTYLPASGTKPGKLFYILQNYNRSTMPVLVSYNIYDNSTDATDLNIASDAWSQLHMTVANYTVNGSTVIGLFVFATGARLASLFSTDEWAAGTFGQLVATAGIPRIYSAIASIFYYKNFIYFTSFSNQAAIARISVNNFCKANCGLNGYCDQGVCACQPPYQLYTNQTTQQTYCDNPFARIIILKEVQDQVAIVFFSIITSCLVFIAMVGWASWYKIRTQASKL